MVAPGSLGSSSRHPLARAPTLNCVTSINDLTDPHRDRLAELSDEAILAELAALRPLPDESDARWHEEPFELFGDAGPFVALADQVGERRLAQGIGLLLDKVCFGDPGEMMRGLRHALEAACDSNWSLLADMCASSARSSRPGTRLWATNEIAILRDPTLVDVIRDRLSDVEPEVRREAIRAAEMLAQQHLSDAESPLVIVYMHLSTMGRGKHLLVERSNDTSSSCCRSSVSSCTS